jgi:hypothetical protein
MVDHSHRNFPSIVRFVHKIDHAHPLDFIPVDFVTDRNACREYCGIDIGMVMMTNSANGFKLSKELVLRSIGNSDYSWRDEASLNYWPLE